MEKGVETIGLYAYPNLIGFYSNLGFRYDEHFFVLKSAVLKAISAEALSKVGKEHIEKREKFDSRRFGGDRRKLLKINYS